MNSLIKDEVGRLLNVASSKLDRDISPPSVVITHSLGSDAGLFVPMFREISFNAGCYEQNPNWFLRHVVPHEVAHLVTYETTGSIHHDEFWRKVMREVFKRPAFVLHPFVT